MVRPIVTPAPKTRTTPAYRHLHTRPRQKKKHSALFSTPPRASRRLDLISRYNLIFTLREQELEPLGVFCRNDTPLLFVVDYPTTTETTKNLVWCSGGRLHADDKTSRNARVSHPSGVLFLEHVPHLGQITVEVIQILYSPL